MRFHHLLTSSSGTSESTITSETSSATKESWQKAQQTVPEAEGHIGQLVHLASQKSGAETVTISGTSDEALRQTRKFLKRNQS